MTIQQEGNELSFADQLMQEAGIKVPETPAPTTTAAADDKPADEDEAAEKAKPATETTPTATATPEAGTPETTEPATAADDDDISEEKLIAALKKKTGRDFKSLSELTTPAAELSDEDKKAAEENKRSAAIEFGKANKLFSQDQYDKYVAFNTRSPLDVVRDNFATQLLKDNADMTREEADELFGEYYHLDEDEDSLKYKRAQGDIKKEYEELKRKDFGKILDVTDIYDQVQDAEKKAVSYKNQVETLFTQLPQKFSFTIDKDEISFPVDFKNKQNAEILAGIKSEYLTKEMMQASLGPDGKVNPKLLDAIKTDLQAALQTNMITEVARSYAALQLNKAKMGRKGAIEMPTEAATGSNQTFGLSDEMLKEAGYPVGA